MKKLRVTVNGVTYDVEVEVLEDDEDTSGSYGFSATNIYSAPPAAPAPARAPAAAPAPAAPSAPAAAPAGDGHSLTSPLPGVIKDVKVKAGDAVKENDPVIVMEAMKMETVVSSPVDGTVKEVLVSANQSVQQGEVLVTFD